MIGTTSSGTLIVLFGMYVCYIRTRELHRGHVHGRRPAIQVVDVCGGADLGVGEEVAEGGLDP
jgi:hypothetical protein